MAELKDFISSVLTEICEGVHDATARIEQLGGVMNPRAVRPDSPIEPHTKRPIIDVSFDVSVEAEATKGNTGRVGVLVATVGMGTERADQHAHRSANSVRFTVPLVLPVSPDVIRQEHQDEDERDRKLREQHAKAAEKLNSRQW